MLTGQIYAIQKVRSDLAYRLQSPKSKKIEIVFDVMMIYDE